MIVSYTCLSVGLFWKIKSKFHTFLNSDENFKVLILFFIVYQLSKGQSSFMIFLKSQEKMTCKDELGISSVSAYDSGQQ